MQYNHVAGGDCIPPSRISKVDKVLSIFINYIIKVYIYSIVDRSLRLTIFQIEYC